MKSIWITWNNSQRSKSLSKDLDTNLFIYDKDGNIFIRNALSCFHTVYLLMRYKPDVICLQYSYLLLIIVVIFKLFFSFNTIIICDCHTKAIRNKLNNIFNYMFISLKKLCFQYVDLSIISNKIMIEDIIEFSSSYMILPDKIPEFVCDDRCQKHNEYCVFVGSYAVDEPLNEVIHAADKLDGLITIYCTGRIPRKYDYLRHQPYKNIIFTDYIDHNEYIKLLSNSQCVLALTTEEGCLQCAGYEALSLNIPLVISKTQALQNYFGDCAVYIENVSSDIIRGIKTALNTKDDLKYRMLCSIEHKNIEYTDQLNKLRLIIEN